MAENSLKIGLLLVGLQSGAEIGRIAADVSFAPFVLEVDLRLLQVSLEKIVGLQLHARPGWRTELQPIVLQGIAAGDPVLTVERQEFEQGLLLTAIDHVTLKFGDDQGKARDLRRKVA